MQAEARYSVSCRPRFSWVNVSPETMSFTCGLPSRGKFHLKQLAERVALAMEAHRLRPVDIARRGGPSRPTLHRILTNPDYEPDDTTLDRLADALGVSRIWLKEGTGPMDSPTFLASGGGKSAAAFQ